MCTETFRRLPEEKRNRFLDAAWAEFNRVSIEEVSINQIVRTAGVPRGSFYQYFTDKNELFLDLIRNAGVHYVGEYRKILQTAKGNIFRAQRMTFDALTRGPLNGDPLFQRCSRLLELNPGLPLQLVQLENRDSPILAGVRDLLDASGLACPDEVYIKEVFYMTVMELAVAVREHLLAPEAVDQQRRALDLRLKIIEYGSRKQADAE